MAWPTASGLRGAAISQQHCEQSRYQTLCCYEFNFLDHLLTWECPKQILGEVRSLSLEARLTFTGAVYTHVDISSHLGEWTFLSPIEKSSAVPVLVARLGSETPIRIKCTPQAVHSPARTGFSVSGPGAPDGSRVSSQEGPRPRPPCSV